MLQAAAYVVCAYLSGMRDSEMQAMKRGCLSSGQSRRRRDLAPPHQVRSPTRASAARRGGRVGDDRTGRRSHGRARAAVRAGRTQARGTTTLWPVLTLGSTPRRMCLRRLSGNSTGSATISTTGSVQRIAPVIPAGPDGAPWRLTTRQFRRTIAWHIANRPFGTIAGMIQYKHASVAAFEGYAGSSRSGFRGRDRSAARARPDRRYPRLFRRAARWRAPWRTCREPRRSRARYCRPRVWRRYPP
jgi:hypothetical protein